LSVDPKLSLIITDSDNIEKFGTGLIDTAEIGKMYELDDITKKGQEFKVKI